ncbi:Putative ketoacyl reductase [Planctomycetes bacterium Poly30]|uniref:Ketoacyl reductase n=1 Tax=Saltatorellus ferox TaxID=2528018 RepID=A0A518EYM4_9BACT|nr:Putative ketoacyl reductase [Planctomycetes bacterium Poly30]
MSWSSTLLVTGCSSGLGLATAHRARDLGWRVLGTARTDADLARIEEAGLEPIQLELLSTSSIESAAEEVLARTGGRLDGLVNNAGYSQLGAIEDVTRDELREQFETNVFGTMELTNRLLPSFLSRGEGRIVFISSVCARVPVPYLGSYSASKAALEALVDSLRREIRGSGVGLHLVEPGIFNTGCYARTTAHFEGVSRSRTSRHADRCRAALRQFEEELSTIPASRNALVADAVLDYLTGKRRSARRVVPGPARVYEIARRLLPDGLLDRAVLRRRGGDL